MEYQICYRRHHLNNILTTITDRRIGVYDVLTGQFDHYEPEQYDTREYYAFGSDPWTVIVDSKQGFNNKEKSHKTNSQTNYDYGFRIYNAGIGKFLRVDPMAEKNYEYTPFVYIGNNPINFIDPDGQDWYEDECSGKMQWFGGSENQDGSFSFTTGYFFSSDLRLEPSGKVSGGLLGWSAFGSGSIGLGGNVSLFGSVGFTRNIGSRISWFLGGVGFCAGVGGGISCGLSQTIPLFDSQFRKK